MAEKINIATIDIDAKSLLNETAQIKKQIDLLNKQQKELRKSGQSSSKQYVQNAVDLKNLTSAYSTNTKALAQNTKSLKSEEDAIEAVNHVLNQEVKTIKQAREQNKLLNKLRNETNATTTEGQAQIAALNAKLDKNNHFIKENVDGYARQKIAIGDYKNQIVEAFKELNIFNGGLSIFSKNTNLAEKGVDVFNKGLSNYVKQVEESTEEQGQLNDEVVDFTSNTLKGVKSGKSFTSSLGSMTKGVIGLTRATLAFLATPLGVVLAAIAAIFALVANAMNRSEESTNKITKIFTIFSGVVNKLLSFLEPLGDFIINGLVAGFELLGEIADRTLGLLASALAFLGFDDAAASVAGFTDELREAAETAERLANLEAKLTKELRRQGLVQLEFQKQAEKLRQLRDDESKSIDERIKANEELGEVLQEQLKEELRIANLALEVANLRIQQDGERTELLDAQADALLKIAEIEERITSQTSEQLTNRNALLKEQNDLIRERIRSSIRQQEQELELLKLQDSQLATSLEDRLALQEEYAQEELAIQKRRLVAEEINETEYQIKVKQIENDLAATRQELRDQELQRQQDFEARRDELLNSIRLKREEDEQARQELQLQIEYEKQLAELEALEISESQKTQLLTLIAKERELALEEIRDSFRQQEIEKLKESFDKNESLARANASARINIAKQIAGALTGILGDSLAAQIAGIAVQAALDVAGVKAATAAASAKNLAQATAAAPPPFNTGLIIQAGIQNAALSSNSGVQITKIITAAATRGLTASLSRVKKFREGGIMSIEGNSHENGGVPIFAGNKYIGEAEGGEGIGILSRPAFDSFMGFNNQFTNGSIGTTFAQNGGVLTPDLTSSGSLSIAEIEAIVSSFPSPVVYVEDIKTGVSNANAVEIMADI